MSCNLHQVVLHSTSLKFSSPKEPRITYLGMLNLKKITVVPERVLLTSQALDYTTILFQDIKI
jgi:hypothetical protein